MPFLIAPQAGHAYPSTAGHQRLPKILTVTDDAGVAGRLDLQLRKMGYAPMANAANAEQAMSYIAAHCPDLVLIDAHLGRYLGGMELAKSIQTGGSVATVLVSICADGVAAMNNTASGLQRHIWQAIEASRKNQPPPIAPPDDPARST